MRVMPMTFATIAFLCGAGFAYAQSRTVILDNGMKADIDVAPVGSYGADAVGESKQDILDQARRAVQLDIVKAPRVGTSAPGVP